MEKLFNKKSTKEKRLHLRKNQTEAEELLWKRLRAKKFLNLKFFRQYGIGEYIADFYCPRLKVVIELDGAQHYTGEGKEYDEFRAEYMFECGIKTIRFSNWEIINDIDKVLKRLKVFVGESK